MRARPGMSVHREDAQRDAEAREAGYAAGVNDALAWLVDRRQFELARQMRADFSDQSIPQETAP